MDNLEYIDDYFKGTPLQEQKNAFEQKILTDPLFAEDVAFYLSASEVLHAEVAEQKKNRFRELYNEHKPQGAIVRSLNKTVTYIAAAAVILGIVIGTYLFTQNPSPNQLANQYIKNNLTNLGVTMSSRQDSMQTGLSLYNEGKFSEALQQFEAIIKGDNTNFTAKEYAGLASLQMNDFNKALNYFKEVEQQQLYANRGKFYHALTLLKRNGPNDTEQAKKLLEQVRDQNLEGKETAVEWLKKL